MTHKFKFGDRVIDKDTRLGECVVINASENFVYIMNEQGSYNTIARPESLELIPHPDTVRLEFVAGTYGPTLYARVIKLFSGFNPTISHDRCNL